MRRYCVLSQVQASPAGSAAVYLMLARAIQDGRLHDARHTAATVLLILGVPDVVIDSIMGWARGTARMRARYMHVTGTMLRKVAQQVGDALWVPPGTGEPLGTEEKSN
ncbi:hypothetical protein ALMP_50490 [Streptomyces sp. A012304]|nr:hypothetical protein ALMP_50490 [Streptomyces sp. A012304]